MLYRSKADKHVSVEALQVCCDEQGFPDFNFGAMRPAWYREAHSQGKMWVEKYNGEDGHGILVNKEGEEQRVPIGDYVVKGEDGLFVVSQKGFEEAFEHIGPCKECIYFARHSEFAPSTTKEEFEKAEKEGWLISGVCMASPYMLTNDMEQLFLGVDGREDCRRHINDMYQFSEI